jgi:TolB protein
MKNNCFPLLRIFLPVVLLAAGANFGSGQNADIIRVAKEYDVLGGTKPVPVSLEGFTGEVADVLKFDLYVQGFSFVSPEEAQYQISGTGAGSVQGRLTDRIAKSTLLTRSYTGSSLRRQAHAFADDIVQAITHKPGIGQTKIAFKVQKDVGNGEIYVADIDGHNEQSVTHDKTIVAAPAWVPGHLALYYTSYQPGNPDIYYHNLTTGQRRIVAGYSGLNTSAAVSPSGSRVAMILSKGGSPDVWVSDAEGKNLQQLTRSAEDESSPCWSPDGQWICFATRMAERRVIAKVPSGGGEMQRIPTTGAPNPTEPDWSPDGKWIAFTSQAGGFSICVMPADGSAAPTVLVAGEDPSWAPNSRTLIFARRAGGHYTLSVLDVFTKQVKDIARISGSDSQPAWSR